MKKAKALVKVPVILVFLLISVLWASETVEELEKQLHKASSPLEKLEYLGALMEINMQEAPQQASKYGKQALKILDDFPDDKKKVKVLLGICGASCWLGDYREALDMGRQAETLARKIDDKRGLAAIFAYLANIYFYYSDFHKALDYAFQAKTVSEELVYKRGIASALNSIARVHRNIKEYKKALSTYREALEISKELKNTRDVATILSNMAHVYSDLKQYRKSLDFYFRALKIMEELDSEIGIARMTHRISSVYSDTGEHLRALQYSMKSLKLSKKIGNRERIAFALGSMGRDYGNLKDYVKALDYMDKSLEIAVGLGRKDIICKLYKVYTNIYEAAGDYKSALLYHKKFKQTSDEIVNQERNKEIAHLQVVYDVEKKEKENQLLKNNNHIQKLKLDHQNLELDRQKMLRNFSVLVSVLVIIIALVTYNRYRTRKKTERVLRASEQKLKKMNTAKDKLFAIIGHDLGSPLNSLLLSARHLENHYRSLDEQERGEFIHNIYKQTQDMTDILENLLQWALVQIGKIRKNPERIDLYLLIGETLEQIKTTARKKKIQLSVHIPENTMAWADKHMMTAVMRNLLSNAIKYTHPGGEIKIMSKDNGDKVKIIVSDNGVGMDKEKSVRLFKGEFHESTRGTANEKGTGLGLVLCREFVEKNGGQIWVQSQLEQGSCFNFTIPRHHYTGP